VRQFSELPIANLSGGLTDEYKSDGIKFNEYLNFIPTSSDGAKLRNGLVPFDKIPLSPAPVTVEPCRSLSKLSSTNGEAIIVQYDDKLYKKIRTEFSEISTPSATPNLAFPLIATEDNVSVSSWRSSLIINPTSNDKAYRVVSYSDGSIKAQTASMPEVTAVAPNGDTDGDRLFAICIIRKYTDSNGYSYREYSPEYLGQFTTSIAITSVTPTLASLSAEYIQAELSYALFVTVENGTALYLADESISPNTLAYTGSAANDRELQKNERGFFLSEEAKREAPICKYMTIVNDTAYYCNITEDSGDELPFRLFQSVSGMPTSVLASGYHDIKGDIYGIGEVNGLPIVLSDLEIYRIDGLLGVDGSGSIRSEKINGSNGGISHRSIVTTDTAMYYAGTDGFYRTDGYTAVNISGAELYKTYVELTKNKDNWAYIQGEFDRDNNLIYWNIDGETVYCYSIDKNSFSRLNYPETGSGGIRTISIFSDTNAARLSEAADVSGAIVESGSYKYVTLEIDSMRQLVVDLPVTLSTQSGDYVGTIESTDDTSNVPDEYCTIKFPSTYDFSATVFTDSTIYARYEDRIVRSYMAMNTPLVKYSDTTLNYDSDDIESITDYTRTSIDYDMITSGIGYGAIAKKKFVKSFTVNIDAKTGISMEPYVVVNDSGNDKSMAPIVNRNQFRAFYDGEIWDRESANWFPDTVIRDTRHLPKGFTMCWHNQLGVRSAETGLFMSNDYNIVTLNDIIEDGGNKYFEFVLDVVGDLIPRFPKDVEGMKIIVKDINSEEFSTRLKILELYGTRTGIKCSSDSKLLSSAEIGDKFDWIIYGKPVEQSFELLTMGINFSVVSDKGAGASRKESLSQSYE
jgi:hypothetical protein